MRQIKVVLFLLLVGLMLPSFSYAESKIGVVNMQRVMAESSFAKRIREGIERDLKPQSKRLQAKAKQIAKSKEKFEKDAMTMSNSQRIESEQKIMNQLLEVKKLEAEFANTARSKDQQALQQMSDKVRETIDQIAQREGYDLILHAETVLYSKGATDLTDKLIKAMK